MPPPFLLLISPAVPRNQLPFPEDITHGVARRNSTFREINRRGASSFGSLEGNEIPRTERPRLSYRKSARRERRAGLVNPFTRYQPAGSSFVSPGDALPSLSSFRLEKVGNSYRAVTVVASERPENFHSRRSPTFEKTKPQRFQLDTRSRVKLSRNVFREWTRRLRERVYVCPRKILTGGSRDTFTLGRTPSFRSRYLKWTRYVAVAAPEKSDRQRVSPLRGHRRGTGESTICKSNSIGRV